MPKYLTHWMLAEDAALTLDETSRLRQVILRHPNLFMAGAVIPDAPFYLLFGPGRLTMPRAAESFHDTRENSFGSIPVVLNAGPARDRDRRLALSLGVLTHIAVDAAFHPFVYYVSGSSLSGGIDPRTARYRHHTLETYLDLFFSRNFLRPKKRFFSGVLAGIEMDRPAFLDALAGLFSLKGPEKSRTLARALRMNGFFQRLFSFPALLSPLKGIDRIGGGRLKPHLAHFFPRRLPSPDRLFRRQYDYRHPVTGAPVCRGVAEMGGQAVATLSDLFRKLEATPGGDAAAAIAALPDGPNLYTGMVGRGKSDMGFFDPTETLGNLIFFS